MFVTATKRTLLRPRTGTHPRHNVLAPHRASAVCQECNLHAL